MLKKLIIDNEIEMLVEIQEEDRELQGQMVHDVAGGEARERIFPVPQSEPVSLRLPDLAEKLNGLLQQFNDAVRQRNGKGPGDTARNGNGPDEVKIEAHIKASALGWVLGAEGGLRVTMTWKKK